MEQNNGLTLSDAAYFGRMTIKFGSILLVLLIVGRFFFDAAVNYWIAMNPPAPPPPTVGFGILPGIKFPTQTPADKPKGYQLETPNGAFPQFRDRAKVFLLSESSLSLLADKKAREVASELGYVFEPTVLSERTYRWSKATPLQSTLEMDIQNLNFSITTNYLSRADLLTQRNLPNETSATSLAKSLLSSTGGLQPDIATVSGQIKYLKGLGGDVGPAASFSDADFIRVDIKRLAVDNRYQFYSADDNKGVIHAIIAGGLSGRDQVVHYENHYQEADYLGYHTYPLRSVNSAWQVLQAGEGYIVNKGTFDTAVIRDVYLGYFEDFNEDQYLQPIFVFEGDGGFLGYVPAIDPRYIQQQPASSSPR